MKNLTNDEHHAHQCHERWVKDRNRTTDAAEYPDEWYATQCGGCVYYVRLHGALEPDWGVCTNDESPMDRKATFEHDGCDAFELADDAWVF